MEYRILIVEDDPVIAGEIADALSRWRLQPTVCKEFSGVLETFLSLSPHLVLMDISLPYFNGYYWCQQIRQHSKVPIIFLSSRSDSTDIVMGVNTGGDDYLVKPIAMDVLIAKVQAMLRRVYAYEDSSQMPFSGGFFDSAALTVLHGDQKAQLTRNEARILQTLLSHAGQVVTREQLMLALWDSDAFVDDNTLTVNVNRLRKTLDAIGIADCITTHKSRGYSIHG